MASLNESLAYVGSIYQGLINKVVVAVIILLIGFIIGKFVSKLVQKFLRELELNDIMKKAAGIKISIEEVITYFVKYFIYFIFIVMALNQIGLTTIILHMISAAVIIIVIISIFLGIKDFIPNFISGIFLRHKEFIQEGDHIKVKDLEGKIIQINMVETRIETASGDIICVPNSILTKQEIVKRKQNKTKVIEQ